MVKNKIFKYFINNVITFLFILVYLGSLACFDNFSNIRAKIYDFSEIIWPLCNKIVRENYINFNVFGTGVAYNAKGDFIFVTILSEPL